MSRRSGRVKRHRERLRAEAMQPEPCYHCAQHADGPADIAEGTIEAHWVDTDGSVSDETHLVCGECYAAGHPNGPGYLTPEKARDLRARREWDSQA